MSGAPTSRGALSSARAAASRPTTRASRAPPTAPRSERKLDDDEKKIISAFPNRHAPRRARNFGPPLRFTVDPDAGPPTAVGEFAQTIYNEVHKYLRSEPRRRDRRVRYDKFNLSINYESKISGGPVDNEKKWRYLDLGRFDRSTFQSTDEIIDRIWEDMLDEGSHYGDNWVVYRFQYIMVDIEWNLVGACDSQKLKIRDEASGMILQSYKSKAGSCGPVTVLKALKEIKNQIDPAAYQVIKGLKGYREAMNKARPANDQLLPRQACSPSDLHVPLRAIDVNLVVYDVAKLLDQPIYGQEGLPSIATIRLAWCSPDSLYSNGQEGHYLRIIDTHYTCPKCEEYVNRNATVKHFCKWTCEYCSLELKCSAEVHTCEQKRLDMSEIIDNNLNCIASDLDESKEQLVEKLLLATPEEDEKTKLQWKQASDAGHLTMLLGSAGSGKTFAVCEYIQQMLSLQLIREDEIAIVSAEGVGVTPYLRKLAGTQIHIGTIHSLLSLRVGMDPTKNAQQILHVEKRKAAKERIEKLQLLIIDEIGSCNANLLESIHLTLALVKKNSALFGATRMIFTGDFRQRASTSSNAHEYVPLFMTSLWARMEVKVFLLRYNHRLTNVDGDNLIFHRIALRMSMGVMSQGDRRWLADHTVIPEDSPIYDDPEVVHLVMTNEEVYGISKQQIFKFHDPSTIMSYEVKWEDPNSPGAFSHQHRRVYDKTLYIAKGVPVMFTSNRYSKQPGSPFNGTVGKVVNFDDDSITVQLETGEEITVRRHKISGLGGSQFDLRLCFSRTIHKSQGASMEKVCVHPRRDYRIGPQGGGIVSEAALMYVAITRVHDIKNLYFSRALRNDHVTVCTRSALFMHFIEQYDNTTTREMVEMMSSEDGAYHLYSLPMRSVSPTITINDKSVIKSKQNGVPMFSRETIEAMRNGEIPAVNNFYTGNFSRVVYFDYETATDPLTKREVPYFVVANYWENYSIKNKLTYGVRPEGGLEPYCNNKFCEWLFGEIINPQCKSWKLSGYKQMRAPIRLIAYNGSNFDFQFLVSWLLTENTHEGFEIRPTMKGSTIVCMTVFYKNGIHMKKALECWDPCLLIASSLSNAHKDFCPEKNKKLSKDCFPHLWIKKIGAEKVFAENKKHLLRIKESFPPQMWSTVYKRIEEGTLIHAPQDDSVWFNPIEELMSYADKDVVMLEDVVESLSMTIWNDIFPRQNIPVFNFPTASSLGFHATIFFLDEEHKIPKPPSMKNQRGIISQIYRLSLRLDKIVREGCLGGRTLNRALYFISSQYEEIKQKHLAGTLTADDYMRVQDALYYIDCVGMYHYIAQNKLFPYGPHLELTRKIDIDHFFMQFCQRFTDEDFPMFMCRLDVYPNPHDVESALPSRGERGRLLWDNEPKIQQVYTSVHLKLAFQRGFRLENPTWILTWGTRDSDHLWHGKQAKLFETSCKKWEQMRLQGGAVKTCAKLIANSGPYGGMLKRDFFSENVCYVTSASDQVCPEINDYTGRHRDAEMKCLYEKGFMRSDGGCVVMTKWEKQPNMDAFTCARASYIGCFILAYAHELIDTTIEELCGTDRRSGEITYQPHNGDTDSIMVHMKHFGVEKNVEFDSTKLGTFNDDLKKLYKAPKTIMFDIDGRPMFVKILRQANPAKKLYAMDVITPDGRFLSIDPKSKGIAKGHSNLIMTGKRKRELEQKVDYDPKRAVRGSYEERREEKEKLEAFYNQQPMITKLSHDDLANAIHDQSSDGIVAVSRRMKKHGATPDATSLRRGYGPFSIENVTLSRHILSGGAKFPPERVAIDTPDDPTTMWSVPKGWIPKTADCDCFSCKVCKL